MQSTKAPDLAVRAALTDDAEQVAAIYNHCAATTVITFEEVDVAASC